MLITRDQSGNVRTRLDVSARDGHKDQQVADLRPWAAENGSGSEQGYEPAIVAHDFWGSGFGPTLGLERSRLVSADQRDEFIDQLLDRLAARLPEFVPPPSTPNLITADQLASRLSVSVSTITRYRKSGMPTVSLGRNYRYDLAACLAWLKGRAA